MEFWLEPLDHIFIILKCNKKGVVGVEWDPRTSKTPHGDLWSVPSHVPHFQKSDQFPESAYIPESNQYRENGHFPVRDRLPECGQLSESHKLPEIYRILENVQLPEANQFPEGILHYNPESAQSPESEQFPEN